MAKEQWIDLRSDTVTRPTALMRQRMAEAEVGDDVYGDDPTVSELEAMASRLMGKEAAMFVPSGTMGNQLAIMTHTRPGDEMIAGKRSHVIAHEVGAPARLSGVGYALVDSGDNMIRPDDIRQNVRPARLMSAPTTLLCLENALSDGNVVPLDVMMSTYACAKEYGLAVHLDGARIFNAALALGVEEKEIAKASDSVMFCLSKGLCAPIGSVLCGSSDFIARARKNRKMLGGGMRQAGIIAAAGICALEEMTQRLQEDHDNALYLADLLEEIPGIFVHRACLKINMVFWTVDIPSFDEASFIKFMAQKNILCNGCEVPREYRFVTHHDVSKEQLQTAVAALQEYVRGL
ncbi:MAG: low-specificity L-threonine aldolase [Saezia sp.]